MVVNRLQDALPNSQIALRASRLNCKKKIKWEHILFFRHSDRDFYSENNTSITSHKKITLTFETNDEHQARSYQNALRYSVITKLS
jgi:hypothetical protein